MNNKPILVLQFRNDQSLKHERKQIVKHGKFKNNELKFVNVMDLRYKIPKPSEMNNYKAVIIAGSGQYNISHLPEKVKAKIKRVYPLVRYLIKSDFPTLGICFGHQLIANLHGGNVENHNNQAEDGTYLLRLTKLGKKSKLFKNIPGEFYAVLGHKDSVTKIPKGAKLLASSDRCRVQAYKLKKNIFCLQSHPELDKAGLLSRLMMYPEYLKHNSLDDVRKESKPVVHAPKIIHNFKKMVYENGGDTE